MFAKHLPPSASLARVLALDEQAAAELAGLAQVTPAHSLEDLPDGPFDAVAGSAAPGQLETLAQRLRPGGRLILTHAAGPEALLAALTEAGLIHCLSEAHGELSLYRGERPPVGSALERTQTLAAAAQAGGRPDDALPIADVFSLKSPFVFLLIFQTPNKPAWKLVPGEPVDWRAATLLPALGEQPVLLAFSSLVKAVAYMQRAVLARRLDGINKVGKFPAAAAQGWPLPLALNPDFELAQHLAPGPTLRVEAQSAITGDE